MSVPKNKISTIDQYISGFPQDTGRILEQIRHEVKSVAPEAVETIKYSMPTFTLKGNLIHFAAFKNHIGLYPAPKGDDQLDYEMSAYKAEKSTLQFPLNKPIPLDLIRRIIKRRVEELRVKR
jgi:uncharacterized protein YdhG (YjbR/CyaY superfamily)